MENVRYALANVRDRLSLQPAQRRLFDRLVHALTEHGDIALAVSGSLVSGKIDAWSDIDLEVILPPGADLQERLDWATSVAQSVGPPLCHFPASHIGLDQILVFFFLQEAQVVKADLYVIELEEYLGLSGARLVVDPGVVSEGRKRLPVPRDPEVPDFEDLDMKFCGWLWYTFTKIERGELLEALNSLEVMRTRALLPSLQCIHALPYEGCRRLETRLPPDDLRAATATVATSVEPAELRRSLLEMARLFARLRPRVAERLGRDHRVARLDIMIRHVETLCATR